MDSYQKILNFARTTTTTSGLKVTASLDRHHYPTGVTTSPAEIAAVRIRRHNTLPKWNYTITPQL